jgi:hypothetical protein
MRIVAHHGKHAHILFLRLSFVLIHIERSRRPKRHASRSRELLQSASRSPTTLTVLVKRLEKLRKISEKPSSCTCQGRSCPPLATVTSRAGLRFFCLGPALTRIRLQNGTRKRNTPSSRFVDATAAAVERAHPSPSVTFNRESYFSRCEARRWQSRSRHDARKRGAAGCDGSVVVAFFCIIISFLPAVRGPRVAGAERVSACRGERGV